MTFKPNPKVLDLSHYDAVDAGGFEKVRAAGYVGIINKATEGPGMTDKTYAPRRKAVYSAGLLYGAYHFLRPGNIANQVGHFLEIAQPDDRLELALDHEDPKVPLAAAEEFMSLVYHKVGRFPVLYSGFLIKQQLGAKKDAFWSKTRLWLAQYGSNPRWPPAWQQPWLIQFTGDGVGPQPHWAPGIKLPGGKGLDINSFAGTDDELRASWAT